MSIDLHESVSAGQHVAKRARHRARSTVEAARDAGLPDLHDTAHAAKKAAKHTAKRAAREAAAAATRATRRTNKKASSRVVRVVVVALLAGAVVGVAVTIAQRVRVASPRQADIGPDPFGAAVTEADRELANL